MVVGIGNRTENWKTAKAFAPYFGNPDARRKLAGRLCETDDVDACNVHLELFWKGTRDYLHCKKEDEREDAKACLLANGKKMLPDIRRRILDFERFRNLKEHNYALSSSDSEKRLLDNLYNTEIDIVIETPSFLFIGEAKHEMSFGADSRLVLVHQLIRQYVMAKVLLETLGCKKEVVPFVIGDKVDGIKKRQQVKFMIGQGWMKECNVLHWGDVTVE